MIDGLRPVLALVDDCKRREKGVGGSTVQHRRSARTLGSRRKTPAPPQDNSGASQQNSVWGRASGRLFLGREPWPCFSAEPCLKAFRGRDRPKGGRAQRTKDRERSGRAGLPEDLSHPPSLGFRNYQARQPPVPDLGCRLLLTHSIALGQAFRLGGLAGHHQ